MGRRELRYTEIERRLKEKGLSWEYLEIETFMDRDYIKYTWQFTVDEAAAIAVALGCHIKDIAWNRSDIERSLNNGYKSPYPSEGGHTGTTGYDFQESALYEQVKYGGAYDYHRGEIDYEDTKYDPLLLN